MTQDIRPIVVVGVDGSAGSSAALDWAEAYATATGATLELLIAWHWPNAYGMPIATDEFNPEQIARDVVAKTASQLSLPADRVSVTVLQGSAGRLLVGASTNAALLVVGKRGHGEVTDLLLGSVSTFCSHHSHCPVVVMPSTHTAAGA